MELRPDKVRAAEIHAWKIGSQCYSWLTRHRAAPWNVFADHPPPAHRPRPAHVEVLTAADDKPGCSRCRLHRASSGVEMSSTPTDCTSPCAAAVYRLPDAAPVRRFRGGRDRSANPRN